MHAREMKVDDINVGRRTREGIFNSEGAKLRQSIEQMGLRRPLAVAPDGQLIDGWRRLITVKQLGWRSVAVSTVASLQEAVESLIAARTYSAYPSSPMTISEAVRLGLILEKLPRRTGRDQRILIANGVEMSTDVKISTGTWQRLRTVGRPAIEPGYPAEERELAEKLLHQLDEGSTTASAAHRALQQLRDDAGRGQMQTTALTGETAQRRALTQANATLSGVVYGLNQIRDFDVPNDELATLMNEMARYRTELAGFVRRMRKAVEGS